nr:hypothetical protein [Tanacetum cinerariifolium]
FGTTTSHSTTVQGGLPTPAALCVVTQTTRKLLIEQAGECLTQLEDQENVTDLVAWLRMQSNALTSGALLQNLDKVKESQEQFDFFRPCIAGLC